MNSALEDAGAFARFTSACTLVISAIVALIMFVFGVSALIQKPTTMTTQALITAVSGCSVDKKITTCTVTVSFSVNGVTYTPVVQTSDAMHSVGQTITVNYDPVNPNNASVNQLSSWALGLILIGFAILILGGAWYNYYIVNRFKTVAAAEGVGEIAGIGIGAMGSAVHGVEETVGGWFK